MVLLNNHRQDSDGSLPSALTITRLQFFGSATLAAATGLVAVTLAWASNTRSLDTMARQIESNRVEILARKETVNRVNEMWFMKEHGISNKEDFQQRHGYPAPIDPKAQEMN